MGRNHFQQQQCADESMWMESQGQQQSYAFHEESWSSNNNYGHKQFPGMHMNNNNNNNNNRLGAFAAVDSEHSMQKHHHGMLGGMHMNNNKKNNNRLGAFAMDSELSMQKHHHGQGKLGGGSHGMFPEGMHSGRKFPFPNGGGNFNPGMQNEYFSEESEYEESYAEEHVGAVTTAKVDEMRYERHNNWGGVDTRYANPYGRNMNQKFQWTAKGV